MSDSVERNKNDPLSSKAIEQEKEGMRQTLRDIGLYEASYSYEDMKKLVCFISESKDMANDNKNVQKLSLNSSNESVSQEASKSNLSQELEEYTDTSHRLVEGYKTNHASSLQEKVFHHDSSSSEFPMYHTKNTADRYKNLDSKDMPESSHKNSNESHSMHMVEKKVDLLPENNKRPNKWQVNLLNTCADENDTPLQQPERRAVEDREPFRSCKNVQTAEMFDKVLFALNHHLRRMAELWYSWNCTTDSKFQWGSPIQVGTANGSLDRKPLTSSAIEQNKIDDTNECNQTKACKRKLNLTASPDKEKLSSEEEDTDADDDEDEAKFATIKKKKIQTYSIENKTNFAINKRANNNEAALSSSRAENDNSECTTYNGVIDDSDDTDDRNQLIQQHESNDNEPLSQDLKSRYPRRIIPPNPRKGFNGPRKKKNNSNTLIITNSNRVQRSGSSTNQDSKMDNVSGERSTNEKKNAEVKPLVLKNLSVRLERECTLLKLAMLEKQKKVEVEREETLRKEEEEKKRKEENARKYMEDIQLRHRQKEESQKWQREKSMKWNNLLHAKSKENKERSRLLREQEEARIAEMEEENRLLQDSDMEIEEGSSNNVNCPICNKSFPSDVIETHAASCEQYDTDDDDNSNMNLRSNKTIPKKSSRRSDVLECNICSTFRTTNGIDYEDHVNSCMQRQPASQNYTSVSIHNIPTSPIRCFRPISEQTDSEIDYKAQFASHSKTQIRPSKKRKR